MTVRTRTLPAIDMLVGLLSAVLLLLLFKGAQRFQDRFNRRYTIQPGWNRIHIPLLDAQQAPEGRAMDLSAVMAVGLFATRLERPRTVFLDDIRLLR
jgi:hypothetical protein